MTRPRTLKREARKTGIATMSLIALQGSRIMTRLGDA